VLAGAASERTRYATADKLLTSLREDIISAVLFYIYNYIYMIIYIYIYYIYNYN